MPRITQSILDSIQPVVLVGGQSTRFGRDKLIEQVDGSLLVSAPINALRCVFGARVAIVGRCDQRVAQLADLVIEDPYPGLGPVGGICAALERAASDIFVCAGDLVSIDEHTIRTIVASSVDGDAMGYIADDGRRHPTLGLYRQRCVSEFREAIAHDRLKLGAVLPADLYRRVAVASASVRNINRPEELTHE